MLCCRAAPIAPSLWSAIELAAIIHDPVLLDQPALLEAAGSAANSL